MQNTNKEIIKRRNDMFKSIMANPKLARTFNEAISAPIGSTKREQAKAVLSIMKKMGNKQPDGQGGFWGDLGNNISSGLGNMFGGEQSTSTSTSTNKFNNMRIFPAAPAFKMPTSTPAVTPTSTPVVAPKVEPITQKGIMYPQATWGDGSNVYANPVSTPTWNGKPWLPGTPTPGSTPVVKPVVTPKPVNPWLETPEGKAYQKLHENTTNQYGRVIAKDGVPVDNSSRAERGLKALGSNIVSGVKGIGKGIVGGADIVGSGLAATGETLAKTAAKVLVEAPARNISDAFRYAFGESEPGAPFVRSQERLPWNTLADTWGTRRIENMLKDGPGAATVDSVKKATTTPTETSTPAVAATSTPAIVPPAVTATSTPAIVASSTPAVVPPAVVPAAVVPAGAPVVNTDGSTSTVNTDGSTTVVSTTGATTVVPPATSTVVTPTTTAPTTSTPGAYVPPTTGSYPSVSAAVAAGTGPVAYGQDYAKAQFGGDLGTHLTADTQRIEGEFNWDAIKANMDEAVARGDTLIPTMKTYMSGKDKDLRNINAEIKKLEDSREDLDTANPNVMASYKGQSDYLYALKGMKEKTYGAYLNAITTDYNADLKQIQANAQNVYSDMNQALTTNAAIDQQTYNDLMARGADMYTQLENAPIKANNMIISNAAAAEALKAVVANAGGSGAQSDPDYDKHVKAILERYQADNYSDTTGAMSGTTGLFDTDKLLGGGLWGAYQKASYAENNPAAVTDALSQLMVKTVSKGTATDLEKMKKLLYDLSMVNNPQAQELAGTLTNTFNQVAQSPLAAKYEPFFPVIQSAIKDLASKKYLGNRALFIKDKTNATLTPAFLGQLYDSFVYQTSTPGSTYSGNPALLVGQLTSASKVANLMLASPYNP